MQYLRLFNAATSAPVFIDRFHPIKDIILLDRLASSSFVSICLECSSRRNNFLILVGIDFAVSLLVNFSLMPCFRIKAHLHFGFHRRGSTLCNRTFIHTMEFLFILFSFLYSLRCKVT
jgi:hypothetical protein